MKNKVVIVPSSQGCLGKNVGCEKAGFEILDGVGVDYKVADVDDSNFVETVKILEKIDGKVFVGGDHSITYPLFKKSGAEGLIVFDAHADCVNNFSPPTHEDFVRVLIEEKLVRPENVLLVGMTKVDPIEKKFLEEKGVNCVYYGDSDVVGKISDFLSRVDRVYLSVDIDVLDGKEFFGTGYPDGKMGLDELISYLKDVVESGKVNRGDLVELNPSLDENDRSVEAGREIFRELIEV